MARRGNPNPAGSKPDKAWRKAIIRVLAAKEQEAPGFLGRLADKLVEVALTGDLVALNEIGDRLDGKAVQQLNHGSAGARGCNFRIIGAPIA